MRRRESYRHKTGLLSAGAERMLLLATVLVLSWLMAGCAQHPEVRPPTPSGRITKGPCLLRVSQDRAALVWETDTEGPWGVFYGEQGRMDAYREGTVERIRYRHVADTEQKIAHIHKAWIDGLQPDRDYHYQIAGPNVRSEIFRFRTIPRQTDEVRFIVYGDSRSHPDIHRRLVEQMMEHEVDFVVHSGDLVSRGDEYHFWGPQFFEPLKGLRERVPIYIAKGNHEGRNGTYEKLLVPPGEKDNVAIDYGPLHYFCTDNVSGGANGGQLVARIVRDAQASKALWKFVSYHVPSVNLGGHWSSWQQEQVLSGLAGAGIDFVVTGHSHQYERFRPVEPPGGGSWVTYITAGGGGAPLYPVEPSPYHACAGAVHHFCLFHIKGDHLTMDAIDPNGRTLDHLEMTKTDGRPDERYLSTAVPGDGILLHRSLYEGMNVALLAQPQKGRPCKVGFKVVVPPLSDGVRLTFTLRGDPQAYQLPPPFSAAVHREGGSVHVKLAATPLVAIHLAQGRPDKPRPIEPPLWMDCRYEFGRLQETISLPVTVSGKSLLERVIGAR